MSYQVIARKYRPQRFSDVVGQEHITQTLSNAIEQGRIAHAYLFCGPRGTGKTTIARIFAKCLNCTDGPKAEIDDHDPRCQEIAEGRSMDVLEIDGASNNGVEQVRDLRESCKYAPANSRFKIYIIDEVHMLSTAAFNALLKTLEEPPAHVKFMFATTEAEKVLPTILSRCQRFDLRRIPAALIVQHLGHIAKQEGVQIDEPALHAIARGAEGGMRDAESTLDQLISFCGEKIEESDVLSMFGLAARSQILQLVEAILTGEVDRALREFNELAKQGKDLGRLIADLLNHFRNLLIHQVSRGDLSLLEVTEAEAAALARQSSSITADALTRIMEVLTDCEGRLRDTASKKILVEVTIMKAVQARQAVSIETVLNRLQELRAEGGGATHSPSTAASTSPAGAVKTETAFSSLRESLQPATPPPSAPAPVATPATAPKTATIARPQEQAPPDTAGLRELWSRIVDAAGRASPFSRTYLLEAHPVSFEKNLLVIGFDPAFADHLGLVDNARTHTLLQTKLSELGYPRASVKFIEAEAPANWTRLPENRVESPVANTALPEPEAAPTAVARPKPAAGPTSIEEFKNDPLIQKALEIFKGHIVDVRA